MQWTTHNSQFTHWCVCHRIVRTRDPKFIAKNETEGLDLLQRGRVCQSPHRSSRLMSGRCVLARVWVATGLDEFCPRRKEQIGGPALRCPSQQTRLPSTCHPNNRFTSSFTFPLVSTLSLSPLGPLSSLTPPPLVWPTGIILWGWTKDIVRSHLQIFWPVLIFPIVPLHTSQSNTVTRDC